MPRMPRFLPPLAALLLGSALAAPTPRLDSGDTAWMLVASALVMLMTPGLAFFYGGLSRGKSVLNTMMMSFIALGVVSVLWVVVAYSLAFAPGGGSLIGSLANLGLRGMTNTLAPLAPSIPSDVYMVFQLMFAVITPALISGALLDRMRFGAFTLFIALWSLLIYAPLAHWVWSPDGWLSKLGALDFAGGTVVHISSGVSALVAAVVLGPRLGSTRRAAVPHNVPFVLLGAALLWFGWFGFNAGSALGANQLAASAFVTTNTAAAAAMLMWLVWEVLRGQKPSAVGAATGAVVGLVAITPACGYVTPLASLVIGVLGATASFWVVQLKNRGRTDDALDVFACHGVGGMTGALLTGVFASRAVNPASSGLLDGHWQQLPVQALAVLATVLFAGLGSFILLRAIGAVMPLRLTERQETLGIDLTAHEEDGYSEAESPLSVPLVLGSE